MKRSAGAGFWVRWSLRDLRRRWPLVLAISLLIAVGTGLATGLGFIGGGAILKLSDERRITGLTTAAGLWMTCAVGVAVGLGRFGSALIGVVLAWIILALLGRLEQRIDRD